MIMRNRKITGSVSRFWLAIFVVMPCGVRAEPGPQMTSKYTSTARKNCISFKEHKGKGPHWV